ncbi:DUF11 domain-containing protein [Occultella glacieicola]|uniref:DUF11 domain-containing protein n=1 Tax=Occultella glacieicola TaxID=2518684 RepID=A0ABY2E9R6_9MICO|nr:DUF5979 domain-containing protein [Occultella glacieicola]TDE98814.1 DUF11 domain-containing protein [Occultella glacieicola]
MTRNEKIMLGRRARATGRWRVIWAAMLAVVLAGPLAGLGAGAALAAPGDPQYLTVTKTVAPEVVSPGQTFTYTISVNCSEASCLNAVLEDSLPPDLAGYAVQDVAIAPNENTIPREVTWTVDGAAGDAAPAAVTADTHLRVDFTGAVISPVGTGLENGQTLSVTITLQVPATVAPGDHLITNTASTTADNSNPDSDDATVTVRVPQIIDVSVTKAWAPAEQSYSPGAASTIDLSVTNTSNGPVETLVLTEPAAAADGATALDASNPFTITDFTGFSTTTLPAGADAVQVDVYVEQGDGTWAWQAGVPGTAVTLPDGVAPGDVGGVRLTYSGVAIEADAVATVALGLAQRTTHRNTGDSLGAATHTVDNVVAGSATVEGRDPATDTASATFSVVPMRLGVSTTKNISPDRIAAGDEATATIGLTNESAGGVDELRVADLGYFTDTITFGGFVSAPTWPDGAESAQVIYHPLDGGAPQEVVFTQGQLPAAPAGPISGFEVVFTAPDGGIAPGSSSVFDILISSTEDAVAEGETLPTTNTVDAELTAPNGLTVTDSDDAALTLVYPAIDIALAKSVRPSTTVQPGESVVTRLETNLTTTSDYITANRIVVEDAATGTVGDFWDGFDLSSVAPTQVPSETALTIEARAADGTWLELAVFGAQAAPFLASLTAAEIAAALPTGVDTTDLTGIRFTFDNETDAGFASDTTVTPYFSAQARDTLRSGADIPETATAYQNVATAAGSGETEDGTEINDADTGDGSATVEPNPGIGPVGIEKAWNQPSVPAQTSEQRSTTLSWSVGSGYEGVQISDPTNPDAPADSVFEAFDLVRVEGIGADADPYSNGWHLRYDLITAVELYSGGAWVEASAPAGGWIQNGAFAGYGLSDPERADTTGVRITLAENEAARLAATQTGPAYDPYAPAVGSGVGFAGPDRQFSMTWQLRDQMRPSGDWVTGEALYNTPDAGGVNNTALLEATPTGGGEPATDTADDTIIVQDFGPGVEVTKSADPTTDLYIPVAGTPAQNYPTTTFTMTANSDSVARASYVRVTDPPACTDAGEVSLCQSAGTAAGAIGDPFTADVEWLTAGGIGNPFDRFDLTAVRIGASIPAEVDLAASPVWLLRYDAGTYSTEQSTAAAVNATDRADLADVVGISVTFQGSDPATTGGTITAANRLTVSLDAQARTTVRSTGADQVVGAGQRVDVTNRVFAQSYDPILSDGVVTGDQAAASVQLSGGDINVGPTKSVTPDALTAPTRDTPVTVTLGANQGVSPASTLPPAEVRVTDDVTTSPEFWSAFALTGLADIAAPAGADQVRVSVLGPFGADGESAWVDGEPTAVADAELPVAADAYADVQGIAFAFSRADGAFFSSALPAPTWSATAAFTVQLREQHYGTDDPVALEGTIINTVTAVSDRRNGEVSPERTADAVIGLSAGTHEITVQKLANDGNRFASPGALVPWDLSFTNTGTGYLTVTELRDTLPASLVYLGDEPVVTPDPDGLLPGAVTVVEEGQDLVFTWPADGNRMAPGETITIRLLLELQPGLSAGQTAENTMTVRTEENLTSCANIVPGGAITNAWAQDDTTCGTTDHVAPAPGPNLYTIKGVRGELAGAINPAMPQMECRQNLTATGGDYFRTPCAANSLIGGTDQWVLRTLNAGTVTVDELTIFEQLPTAGDQQLISGSGRGSVYRPELIGDLLVTAPEGATTTVEVTTSAGVCVGTWGNLAAQEVCEQNGEQWEPAGDATDWAAVTGLRITVDFSTTAAGVLTPGQFVDVTYSSVNMPASAELPGGAPSDVPAADSFAWNQFGVKFRNTGTSAYGKVAPSRVGVHLMAGAIEIDKVVTGPAVGYAPTAFTADLVCTIEGVQLGLGEHDVLELDESNGYTQRVDGIPVGAACTVTETGELGSFGETSRTGSPVTLTVTEPTAVGQDVPAAQLATITNDYRFTGLSVTKLVATEATEGEFGPFDFTLTCASALGTPVTFDGDATEVTFSLADGATWVAPENTVPAGALCTVTEVDSDLADGIVIVGTDVTDNGDGSAEVEIGTTAGEVTFTNGYDAGILRVVKVVDGDGAGLYGAGPFTFTAVCTYAGDQVLLDAEFVLDANSDRTFGTYPAGTECVVTETATGGANATTLDPADGATTIISGPDGVGEAVVTATNTFVLGALEIVKVVEGDGAELWGSGPFTAQVLCTWDRDGEPVMIDLANEGIVTLSAANGYSVTVDNLLVGSECVVTETATGGATSTMLAPTDGLVTILDPAASGDDEAEVATVTLTNVFDVTSLAVVKVIDGDWAGNGSDGRFEVALQCTWPVDGVETAIEIPGGAVRVLRAPDDLTAEFADLPVGADCVLTESVTGSADSVSITVAIDGTDSVTTETATADVPLSSTTGSGQALATVTNTYDPVPIGPGAAGQAGAGIPVTGVEAGLLAAVAALLIGTGVYLVIRRRRNA